MACDCGDDDYLGAWTIPIFFSFVLPWTVVQFYDAISRKKVTMNHVWARLFLTTVLNVFGYVPALFYVYYAARGGEHAEVGTVTVSLLINSWFWLRNIKGYRERFRLRLLKRAYIRIASRAADLRMQNVPLLDDDGQYTKTFGGPRWADAIWKTVHVNDTIIDNDLRNTVPPLPWGAEWRTDFATARALWNLVWAQAEFGKLKPKVKLPGAEDPVAATPKRLQPKISQDYYRKYNRETWELNEEILEGKNQRHTSFRSHDFFEVGREYNDWLDEHNRTELPKLKNRMLVKENRRERREGLRLYPTGDAAGQQDVAIFSAVDYLYTLQPVERTVQNAEEPTNISDSYQGFLTLLQYVAHKVPSRLTNAWYDTEAWTEEIHRLQGFQMPTSRESWLPRMLCLEEWREVAMHTARSVIGSRPGDDEMTRYMGRIVATSALITVYHDQYVRVVSRVYQIGIQARMTYGWSGRLACYSGLWTRTHVYLALLDGLTVLVIRKGLAGRVQVLELLSAIAAFNIMSERADSSIKEAQHRELQIRYEKNKSKTCRGSGLNALRTTCHEIGIPGAASKLDGLPALVMGWATEYRLGQPGMQRPEHGETHDEIELKYGSSNAFRYPYSLM